MPVFLFIELAIYKGPNSSVVFNIEQIIIQFIIGLFIGSFANVCIYRWPRNKSIVFPKRSYCPWCKEKIPWYDNIPLLSIVFLSGRCRRCKSPISLRYPLVELLIPIIWIFLFLISNIYYKDSVEICLLSTLIITFSLVVTTFTDFDFKIIPDQISYILILGGIFLSFTNPFLGSTPFERLFQSILGGIVGACLIGIFSVLGSLIWGKEGMGMGDLKLLAGYGTFLGWKGIIFILIVSSMVGGIFSLVGLALKKVKRGQYIPFGPFLNFGTLGSYFFMTQLPQFYSNLFLW